MVAAQLLAVAVAAAVKRHLVLVEALVVAGGSALADLLALKLNLADAALALAADVVGNLNQVQNVLLDAG